MGNELGLLDYNRSCIELCPSQDVAGDGNIDDDDDDDDVEKRL